MTRRLSVRWAAVALLTSGLVAGAVTVPGLASSMQTEPPAQFVEQAAAPVPPSASPAPVPATAAVQPREVKASPRPSPTGPRPALATTGKKVKKPRVIVLRPVTALGSQRTLDKGSLVTWMTSPVCLIAGHNTMGWAWLDDLRTGTVVKVRSGPCSGEYKVYSHRSQSRKGGPVPGWMSDLKLDLVLQTCKTRGMGFSLLRRV